MEAITNNFRLGFGTFVDKDVFPYSPWTDQMLRDRCKSVGQKCADRPHVYKHWLDFEESNDGFSDTMEKVMSDTSLSYDDPESGLEALVQALECDDILKWRDVSRKIVVYSTNSFFHLSGSGKFGGATKQSDLSCYTDATTKTNTD